MHQIFKSLLFFSFKCRFNVLSEWSLIFVVSRSKSLWILNLKRLKNSNFSPRGLQLSKFEKWNSGYYWLQICKKFQFCYVWYEVYGQKKKTVCINLVLWDEWIWMNFKADLCVNQDLFSSITLYPLQQFYTLINWVGGQCGIYCPQPFPYWPTEGSFHFPWLSPDFSLISRTVAALSDKLHIFSSVTKWGKF